MQSCNEKYVLIKLWYSTIKEQKAAKNNLSSIIKLKKQIVALRVFIRCYSPEKSQ